MGNFSRVSLLKSIHVVFFGCLFLQALAYGKGLKELSPENVKKEVVKEKAEEAAEDTVNDAVEDEKSTSQDVVDSRKKYKNPMEDRLLVSASFGWLSSSGGEGDWTTSGSSDLTVGYLFPWQFLPAKSYLTVRYSAFDAEIEKDNVFYQGVVEGYHFGMVSLFKFSEQVIFSGGADVGIMNIAVRPLGGIESSSEPDEGVGALVGVSGGAAWRPTRNLEFGGKLGLGFGSLGVFQLAFVTTVIL